LIIEARGPRTGSLCIRVYIRSFIHGMGTACSTHGEEGGERNVYKILVGKTGGKITTRKT
jgi:hypothetical protein